MRFWNQKIQKKQVLDRLNKKQDGKICKTERGEDDIRRIFYFCVSFLSFFACQKFSTYIYMGALEIEKRVGLVL